MKRLRAVKRFVTVAVTAGSLALVTVPASATTKLVLSDLQVDAAVKSMEMTVTAKGLPAGGGLDPASVLVTADGRTLPTGRVVPVPTSTEVQPPQVLLVVDTSGSMAGQPMTDAKRAISAFVAQAPAEVQLGLMSFSTSAHMLVEPTFDRPRVLGAVTELQAQGETSLYDAVIAGVSALNDPTARRLVVLSDGGDTRSQASLDQVLAIAGDSGVSVDAIGFNTGESVQAVLSQIVKSGHGRIHNAASSADLAAALKSTVRAQAPALKLQVLIPEEVRGRRTLNVSAATPQGKLRATAAVTLGRMATAPRSSTHWWEARTALLGGVAAIGAGLVLASLALLGGGPRSKRRTQDVLDRFTTLKTPATASSRTTSTVARTALELADRVATQRNLNDKSTLRLARAALPMTPAEWLLLQVGSSFTAALLLVVIGWNLLFAAAAGTALGVFGPRTYLSFRGERRRRAFEEKLPDALQMTAGSLSAGYSLAQSLDGLVREGSEPMATEIGKALAESRLGVPVETSLDNVAERMGSKDFSWVVMAIRVQKEVGGNLGGVLTTVSNTMRERSMMRRHVKGLSAEGRLSAYILIGLPIFLVLYLVTLRRDYLEPLYTTGIGFALIAAALTLLSLGSFLMSRMVKVEV